MPVALVMTVGLTSVKTPPVHIQISGLTTAGRDIYLLRSWSAAHICLGASYFAEVQPLRSNFLDGPAACSMCLARPGHDMQHRVLNVSRDGSPAGFVLCWGLGGAQALPGGALLCCNWPGQACRGLSWPGAFGRTHPARRALAYGTVLAAV